MLVCTLMILFQFLLLHTGLHQFQILRFRDLLGKINRLEEILSSPLWFGSKPTLNSCPSDIFICVVMFSVKLLASEIGLSFVFTFSLPHFIFSCIASLLLIYCGRNHCETLWLKTATFILYLSWFQWGQDFGKAWVDMSKAADHGG